MSCFAPSKDESASQSKVCTSSGDIESVSDLFKAPVAVAGCWYRGQANGSLEPLPQVLREWFNLRALQDFGPGLDGSDAQFWQRDLDPRLFLEQRLFREFRASAESLTDVGESLATAYLLAQHSGLPTRLLDWTTSPLAALHFACPGEDFDGAVFRMSPERLLLETTEGVPRDVPFAPRSPWALDDEEFAERLGVVYGNPRASRQWPQEAVPAPMIPKLLRGRVRQQGSVFTCHFSRRSAPIPGLQMFRVPTGAKARIRDELASLGVTASLFFPEPAFLAADLRVRWGLPPT
jgi:FRG domain